MKKVILGKTKIETLNIGFGGIPLQRVGIAEAQKIVDFCVNAGVTFFDSARAYTTSERYIGNAVKNRRSEVILASKAPALTDEEMFNYVNVSLNEFGTDYIDLYQIHNVKSFEDADKIFSAGGSYGAFEELRNQRKVLHFGLTSHKREVLDYAIDKHSEKIESIMFPFNIVENQGEELFKKAKALNIATIAMKPLAGGNLNNAPLALRYVLQNEFIDIAIPGIGSLNEARENLHVKLTPLNAHETSRCGQLATELGNDFCRRCGYCTPCTAGIDIPGVFSMQNYAQKYNLKEWASSRYTAMLKHVEDCVKCGLCEKRCPYNLKIIDKLLQSQKDLS